MKRIGFSTFQVLVCNIAILGSCASAQVIPNAAARNGEPEPSRCITEATIQVSASRPQITYPQSSDIRWSVELPEGCASVRVRLNGQDVLKNGNRTVRPLQSSTYSIQISHTHRGVTSQTHASTRVNVRYPDRVIIDPTTENPVGVLVAALDSPNESMIVELCNVELDLTKHSIVIGKNNRSLIASSACARGPRNRGPRIFVTKHRGSNPLFEIRGDNVRFSGFRLEGPTDGIGGGDRLEIGIRVWPYECAGEPCMPTPIRKIKITNMEIYHWSGAAIDIRDNTVQAERGRLFNTNESAVRIRNNYIHHNRHNAGNGYGVHVGGGAYALIEQNVFDQNRHAIAGGSTDFKKDFSGYTLRENLILEGGGKHCIDNRWVWELTSWIVGWSRCWQTHQIDMHGNKNQRGLAHNWCCGIAGETMIIERNTVLYNAGIAIKIRGNPLDKVVVDGNVFRHESSSDAIAQNGDLGVEIGGGGVITNPIDVRPNNIFKARPMDQLGTCDFDLDGKPDKFLATGVTWWVQSGETGQWRYLNTMPEILSQLQLGNIDNDGICDVAKRSPTPVVPPRTYSKNGTGPWVPVQIPSPSAGGPRLVPIAASNQFKSHIYPPSVPRKS